MSSLPDARKSGVICPLASIRQWLKSLSAYPACGPSIAEFPGSGLRRGEANAEGISVAPPGLLPLGGCGGRGDVLLGPRRNDGLRPPAAAGAVGNQPSGHTPLREQLQLKKSASPESHSPFLGGPHPMTD